MPSLIALVALVAGGSMLAGALADPDPHRATLISVTSTLVPCAFVGLGTPGAVFAAAGLVVGPATGYIYGGMFGRGLTGIILRAGAFAVGTYGVALAFDESSTVDGGDTLMLVGGVGLVGLTVLDLAVVGRDVRRHNGSSAVRIAPWRSLEGAPGLALSAAF